MSAATRTVHGLLDEAAAARGGADAAVFPDRRLSYPELVQASHRASRLLLGAGLAPGDCVGLLASASLSQLMLLGAMRLGAAPVPLNPRSKAVELRYLVEHSHMKLLVCDRAGAALAAVIARGACRVVEVD